jgi:hypothetical protein
LMRLLLLRPVAPLLLLLHPAAPSLPPPQQPVAPRASLWLPLQPLRLAAPLLLLLPRRQHLSSLPPASPWLPLRPSLQQSLLLQLPHLPAAAL